MNSDVKLWAKFRTRTNEESHIALTPILFWVLDEAGDYIAYVLSPASIHPIGYALPCTHNSIRETFGEMQGFILHDNLADEIAKLKEWVAKDDDNRSLYIYP